MVARVSRKPPFGALQASLGSQPGLAGPQALPHSLNLPWYTNVSMLFSLSICGVCALESCSYENSINF